MHRVIDGKASGNQTKYVVSNIATNNGYDTRYTAYDFFPTHGAIDPSGNIAKFNKVRVRPGTNSSNFEKHPYGYTDTYFFNGLTPSQYAKPIPTDNNTSGTNASENYKLLEGIPYLTETYNSSENIISKQENLWYVYSKVINSEKSYYARQRKSKSYLDYVTKISENIYKSNGLLEETKTYNRNSQNQEEVLRSHNTYAYEKYANFRGLNIFTVIQKRTYTDNTCTSNSATTWKDYGGNKWGPHKTYVCKISSNADFTNWDGSTPNSNWLKTSEVISIDGHGNVKETSDIDGIHSVVKYGFNSSIPIATITNTTDAESKVELCQEYCSTSRGKLAPNFNTYQNGSDGATQYYMRDEPIRGRVQQVTANLVSGSGGVNIKMGTLNSSKKYVIEFDVKVLSGEIQVLTHSTGKGYTSHDYLTNRGWEHHSYIWDLGNNGNNSQIWLRSKWNTSGSSATFYIDNVRIYCHASAGNGRNNKL